MVEQGKLGVYMNHCPNCGAYFQCDVCPICKTPFPKDAKPEKFDPFGRDESKPQMKKKSGAGKVASSLLIWLLATAVWVLCIAYICWTTETAKNGANVVNTETTAVQVAETVPFPRNGSINAYWDEAKLIELTLINEKPQALFIRFKQNGVCVFEVYLSAFGTASYQVPSDGYDVSIAAGDAAKWKGDEKHFGLGTSYSRARSVYIPEVGLNLTIQNTKSENGDLKPSSKNEFNQ